MINMTLKEFFEKGNKLHVGDRLKHMCGNSFEVDSACIDDYNETAPNDQFFKVVKAKELEQPIPQTKGVEWENGLPPVGVECEFVGVNLDSAHKVEIYHVDGNKVMFLGRIDSYPIESTVESFKDGKNLMVFYSREGDRVFRKPETEAERVEREELEAAYDLYCYISKESLCKARTASFEEFNKGMMTSCREEYLAIVRKTGYRKGGE